LLTTAGGAPIGDKLNSLTAGPRGPLLLQDVVFLDEMAHFDRERIPERVVHAKGAGAFGYFEVTHDITDLCKVCLNFCPLFLCFIHSNILSRTRKVQNALLAFDLLSILIFEAKNKFYLVCNLAV